MNEKSSAALQAALMAQDSIGHNVQLTIPICQSPYPHLEAQIKGLVEALEEIGINGFSNMDRDKARAALAKYKEQTK